MKEYDVDISLEEGREIIRQNKIGLDFAEKGNISDLKKELSDDHLGEITGGSLIGGAAALALIYGIGLFFVSRIYKKNKKNK